MVGPNGNAHVYAPSPGDAKKVADAKLVFVNGLGFEGWLERLVKASGTKAPIVVATKGIKPLERADEHGHDHDHGRADPHAWQSVANAKIYVANIRDALIAAAYANSEADATIMFAAFARRGFGTCAISPPAAYFIYTTFAMVFLTLGPLIGRMNVRTQLAYTLLTVAVYLGFDLALAHASADTRSSTALSLLTLGAIGALAARQNEIQARRAFLQRRVIRRRGLGHGDASGRRRTRRALLAALLRHGRSLRRNRALPAA